MKNKIIMVIACLASISVYSQKGQVAKKQPAKVDDNKVVYVEPVETYERMVAKGYKTPDMLLKVANACYFRSDLVSAAKWYGELFTIIPEQEAVIYYRYAQSLKAVKEFAKSDEMMAVFLRKRT